MNPDQNNQSNQPNPQNELQLPSETPMNLTVPENTEPKPIEPTTTVAPTTSIQPEIKIIQEAPPEPPKDNVTQIPQLSSEEVSTPQIELIKINPTPEPTPEINNQTPSNLTFDSTPDYSLTSKVGGSRANTQTIVLIIAGILGVLIVFGGGYYFLIANKSQPVVNETSQTQTTPSPVTETPKAEPTPTITNKVLSLTEYQVAVSKIEAKTVNTIKNTPINPANNTLSLDQIRFASDDLFANYQELLNLNIPDNVKPLHSILITNYKSLVDSYDVILKSIKETNKISPEAKTQFTANYNKSVTVINDTLLKIKTLK